MDKAKDRLRAQAMRLPLEMREGFIMGLEAAAIVAEGGVAAAADVVAAIQASGDPLLRRPELEMAIETTMARTSKNIAAAIRSLITAIRS